MALYHETGLAMMSIWRRSDTFAHAFLVPPIAAWLVWRQRQALMRLVPQPAIAPLLLAALAALVWLLAYLASVGSVSQLAFVALLVLSVPGVLGWAVARAIMFPLGFLFFSVPLGEFMLPQLMAWTADVTVFALRLSGIAVYREGLQFVIPTGNWSVVEACSGVRYLIASLTVGTLFAYLNYQSWQRRILFVLVATVVPVLANWMRAYLIVLLGHLSGNTLAAGFDHLVYGWVFFGIVILVMFSIGSRWAESEPTLSADSVTGQHVVGSVKPQRVMAIAIGYAMVLAWPGLVLHSLDQRGSVTAAGLAFTYADGTGWQAATQPIDFKPDFKNPTSELSLNLASQGHVVGLYLGYYLHQEDSRKLVSSINTLVRSSDPTWASISTSQRQVSFAGQSTTVKVTELRPVVTSEQANDQRLWAWQFYWIGGTVTANDYLAKAYTAWYRLTGRGDDGAVIVVYTAADQPDEAAKWLSSFLASHDMAIHRALVNAKKGG